MYSLQAGRDRKRGLRLRNSCSDFRVYESFGSLLLLRNANTPTLIVAMFIVAIFSGFLRSMNSMDMLVQSPSFSDIINQDIDSRWRVVLAGGIGFRGLRYCEPG